MERKIGEIFEFGGEWYQCIPDTTDDNCNNCFFQKSCIDIAGDCSSTARSDGKSVVFKKLEKVGEPFYSKFYGKFLQMYKTYIPAVGSNFKIRVTPVEYVGRNEIFIEIKQNKEDMEGNKLNLKPFDIQKAREGKPVCTRDGRKVRIICFDRDWDMHIVALVSDPLGESVHYYLSNGKVDFDKQNDEDLMMLPEKKERWINVYKERCYESKEEAIRHIAPGTHYIDTIRVEWEE